MSWRLAKSLEVLKQQLNERYPTRSKVSDGFLGDQAHSARASDHNPNAAGVVTAGDFTNDPKTLDGQWLADTLIASRDPRIKYVIFNHRMCRSYPAHGKPAWTWTPYMGANSHSHHVHISVSADKALYDLSSPWDLGQTERAESSGDIQQKEEATELPSSPLEPDAPPVESDAPTAKVEIAGDVVKVETNQPVAPPEKVGIIKPEPVGFSASIKKKILTITGGNLTFQIIRDQLEQIRALGLSPNFWLWSSLILLIGGAVWLLIEWNKHRTEDKKQLEITKSLIESNTTATNTVTLISASDAELYKAQGFRIVTR